MIEYAITLTCDRHPIERVKTPATFTGESKGAVLYMAKLKGWKFSLFGAVKCPECSNPNVYLPPH